MVVMLRNQLQLLDEYFWLKVKYSRKYKLLLIILFFAIIFAGIYTFINFGNIFIETLPRSTIASGINTLIAQPYLESIKFVADADENTCYWITHNYDGDSFVVEIEETYSPNKDCYGNSLKTSYIPVDKPVSIFGNSSCICGNEAVEIRKLLSDEDFSIEVVKNE